MNHDLNQLLRSPGVLGVASLNLPDPIVNEVWFERSAYIGLRACLRYFEAVRRFVPAVKDLVPLGTELAQLELEVILGYIGSGCAIALKGYLDENFVGGDNLATGRLEGPSLFDFFEHRTGLTSHLLARTVDTVQSRLHPRDRQVVGPVLDMIGAGLSNGNLDLRECRFVIEIRWMREPTRADDCDCVALVFREKTADTGIEPIIVTHPYLNTHHD